MLQYDVTATVRNSFGKGAARTLRRAGQTPAVLYGPKMEPLALAMDTKSFTKTLLEIQRRNAVINLDIEGGKKKENRQVMIKELQTDPTLDTLVHADFYEVSLKSTVTLSVPVLYSGKAKGVDLGGELVIAVKEVLLTGPILDIPDQIEIDVTPLKIGDKITCADIAIPAKMTLQKSLDTVCVSVVVASVVPDMDEEEEAVAEAAPAEETEAPAEE